MAIVKNLYLVVVAVRESPFASACNYVEIAPCLGTLGFWYRISGTVYLLATLQGLDPVYSELSKIIREQDTLMVSSFDDETCRFTLPLKVLRFLADAPKYKMMKPEGEEE